MAGMYQRTRVKVCGVRSYEVAMAAVDAGADAIGFVFARSSPRFVEPAAAYEILMNLPPLVATVGVFEDPTIEEFADAEEACPTVYTQLMGQENERLVRQVGPEVIRGLKFDLESTAQALMNWDRVEEVGAILVECAARDGAFDWQGLSVMLDDVSKPVFVSGDVDAATVGAAIAELRPFGVDVSSGVENGAGETEAELIEEFCRAVREADAR
jgi:phosphoribosylanthranilate isomerase